MTFSENLKALRVARRLNQKQLAALAGIPANQISKYEHGYNAVGVNNLMKLAKALQVGPEEIDERFGGGNNGGEMAASRNLRQVDDDMLRFVVDHWREFPVDLRMEIICLARDAVKKTPLPGEAPAHRELA